MKTDQNRQRQIKTGKNRKNREKMERKKTDENAYNR